ncbi:hypothetical protein HDV63DRAFT_169189 [Trichoderma sp. SZMC 28014]
MHAWTGPLPRYWPAVIDTSLVQDEEVADTTQLPCFLCPRPTGRMDLATPERPLSSRPLPLARASQNIYQGDQHPPIHSSFFLFFSKFCQPQIHLSVFSPLFVFVFCSGAGLPFYLLILLSRFHLHQKPFNCQLHQNFSVAGQLETR